MTSLDLKSVGDVSCLLLHPLYMENGDTGLMADFFLDKCQIDSVNSATVYQLKI